MAALLKNSRSIAVIISVCALASAVAVMLKLHAMGILGDPTPRRKYVEGEIKSIISNASHLAASISTMMEDRTNIVNTVHQFMDPPYVFPTEANIYGVKKLIIWDANAMIVYAIGVDGSVYDIPTSDQLQHGPILVPLADCMLDIYWNVMNGNKRVGTLFIRKKARVQIDKKDIEGFFRGRFDGTGGSGTPLENGAYERRVVELMGKELRGVGPANNK